MGWMVVISTHPDLGMKAESGLCLHLPVLCKPQNQTMCLRMPRSAAPQASSGLRGGRPAQSCSSAVTGPAAHAFLSSLKKQQLAFFFLTACFLKNFIIQIIILSHKVSNSTERPCVSFTVSCDVCRLCDSRTQHHTSTLVLGPCHRCGSLGPHCTQEAGWAHHHQNLLRAIFVATPHLQLQTTAN